jgi:hypothetical protein
MTLALAVVAILSAGCARDFEFAQVRGTVTYEGKPLPEGTVLFVPSGSGIASAGTIQPDGTYRLLSRKVGDGAVVGHQKVAVVPPYEPQTPDYPKFPLKYQDAETSGFEIEVRKDVENVFDIDLKSETASR